MDSEEKEKQDKLIGKLQWLTERSKRDFKGNPPPFETRKTQQTVELEKKRASQLRAGDTDFLPFWHGTRTLALDARRWNYLKGADNSKFERPEPQSQRYQRVDPESGLTEIQRALCWDVLPSHSSRKPSTAAEGCQPRYPAEPSPTTAAAARCGRNSQSLQQLLDTRSERWNQGTQLNYEIEKPPRKKKNVLRGTKRNAIRLTVQ